MAEPLITLTFSIRELRAIKRCLAKDGRNESARQAKLEREGRAFVPEKGKRNMGLEKIKMNAELVTRIDEKLVQLGYS